MPRSNCSGSSQCKSLSETTNYKSRRLAVNRLGRAALDAVIRRIIDSTGGNQDLAIQHYDGRPAACRVKDKVTKASPIRRRMPFAIIVT